MFPVRPVPSARTPPDFPQDGPFVGREAPLALLDSALDRDATLLAIEGMAGVGKTALAVHWCHRVRDRFPDGLVFADPSACDPRALRGRRALVLFDDVRDPAQVAPVVAAAPECVFVVTSRAPLEVLAAMPRSARVRLDVLSPNEAGRLLEHLVGSLRVNAEPEAAAELARASAYLPLALRVAAVGVVGRHPRRAIAEYVRDLVLPGRGS